MNIFNKIYYFIFPQCRSVSDCKKYNDCNCGKCKPIKQSQERLVLTVDGIKECSYNLCDINYPVDKIEIGRWVQDGDFSYFKEAYNPLPPIPNYKNTEKIVIKDAKELYPLLGHES